MADPWNILGISYNSNSDDIKRAYRLSALQYHHDRTSNFNDNRIYFINEARDILLDPKKLKKYLKDTYGTSASQFQKNFLSNNEILNNNNNRILKRFINSILNFINKYRTPQCRMLKYNTSQCRTLKSNY